eukprot:jgi/Botrbrau1/3803/Bobra.0183s0035.1
MLPAALLGVGVVVGGYTLAKRLMVHRREKVDFLVEVAPPRVASAGKPATGPTYRNVSAKDGFAKMDGVQTLFELFSKSVEKFPNNRLLGVPLQECRRFGSELHLLYIFRDGRLDCSNCILHCEDWWPKRRPSRSIWGKQP